MHNQITIEKFLAVFFMTLLSQYGISQVGYIGVVESGVFTKADTEFGKEFDFTVYTSHGISLKNSYIGIGASYDRYENFALLPITLDLRYAFIGNGFLNGEDGLFGDSANTGGFGMFFYISGGKSIELNQKEANSSQKRIEGIIFTSGIGFLLGSNSDIPFSISIGYKIQEINSESIILEPTPLERVQIKIGVIFKG